MRPRRELLADPAADKLGRRLTGSAYSPDWTAIDGAPFSHQVRTPLPFRITFTDVGTDFAIV